MLPNASDPILLPKGGNGRLSWGIRAHGCHWGMPKYERLGLMALAADKKTQLVAEHRRHEHDTGSAEVQIALLTERIARLTGHLKLHGKDHSSRRGLLKMVGKRSSLLKFLARQNRERYIATIGKLGLRK